MSRPRQDFVTIVRENGLQHFDEPIMLASGELSYDFIDGKAALADGSALMTASEAVIRCVNEEGIVFDAVGGLTMGADHLAHAIALLAPSEWFSVRKQPKLRGTNKLIEGATLRPGVRVLLVDDVVTTGGSIQAALAVIKEAGAEVVVASTLVDRGDVAGRFFDTVGIPYLPLVTYRDLGIARVGNGLVHA